MKPFDVLIVGNNPATWLVAAALAHSLDNRQLRLQVVTAPGSNDILPFASFDAMQPWPGAPAAASGLNEDLLVAEGGASFSLGIALSGWSGPDASYFHPFAPAGAALGPLPFQHIVSKLRSSGDELRYSNYSLASLAAQTGRFRRAADDPSSVLSTLRHGVHLDHRRLGTMLRRDAESAGTRIVEGSVVDIDRSVDGALTAIRLDSGEMLAADLFIDCSIDSLLLQNVAWESWSDWFPFNSFLSARLNPDTPPMPFSQAQAWEDGWLHYVPAQHGAALTAFYDEARIRKNAVHDLMCEFSGTDVDVSAGGSCHFGRRSVFWQGNCLAMGPAAIRLDPIGCSNLSLLQFGIDRLVGLLPGGSDSSAESAEYNRQMLQLCDRARDFALLHFRVNGRHSDSVWDKCRNADMPAELGYTVQLYAALGHLVLGDEEPFDEASWINLLDENGVRPDHYSRIADGMPDAELRKHLDRMRKAMIDVLHDMPLHSEYLASVRAKAGRIG
jgi:tryptophan halogenase